MTALAVRLLVMLSLFAGLAMAETPAQLSRAGLPLLSNLSAAEQLHWPNYRDQLVGGPIQWRGGASYERRYDVPELDRFYLQASATSRRWNGALEIWQRPVNEFWKESAGQLSLAYRLREFSGLLALGGEWATFGTMSDDQQTEFKPFTRVALRYDLPTVRLASCIQSIPRTRYRDNADLRLRGTMTAEWEYVPTMILLAGTTLESLYQPRFAAAHVIPLGETFTASVGFRTSPNEFTGGIVATFGHVVFTYGAAVHPVLGLTHSVGLEAIWGGTTVRNPLQ